MIFTSSLTISNISRKTQETETLFYFSDFRFSYEY